MDHPGIVFSIKSPCASKNYKDYLNLFTRLLKLCFFIQLMDIIEQAYRELFPEKEFDFDAKLKYSAKFSDYNANIRLTGKMMVLSISRKWADVSDEIKIGLIQHLMLKIFKHKTNTTNIDLYNIFLKKIHVAVPKTETDPILESSFHRVNEKYFNSMIEMVNLKWGGDSLQKLASYNYGSDTITMSRIFINEDRLLLDYVMYHEMLHKKHKYDTRFGRSYHHTKRFRKDEKAFEDAAHLEKRLSKLSRKKKTIKLIKSIFK